MINKEVLAQFIYNLPHNQLESFLSRKIWKNYYCMYIEERGWRNTQILLTIGYFTFTNTFANILRNSGS